MVCGVCGVRGVCQRWRNQNDDDDDDDMFVHVYMHTFYLSINDTAN